MNEPLGLVNKIREEKISNHYNAAFSELRDKITAEPLRVKFDIYSGCISEDITREISHRLNTKGIQARMEKYGLFTTNWYLQVEIKLPLSLVHPDPPTPDEILTL